MLISELITWCNSMYQPDETTDFNVSNTKWLMFFNEAGNEIRPHTLIATTSTIDIVANTEIYDIPTDLDVLNEVYRLSDEIEDIYVEMKRCKEETLLGLWDYTLWNKQIKISKPSDNITDGLKLYYWKKLPTFTLVTETIELEDPYVLGYYALSRVELADRQTNEFAIYNAEYLKRLQSLRSKIPEFDMYELESRW